MRTIRATGSIVTRATRRAIISTRSRRSATRRHTAARSGRRRCLIRSRTERPAAARRPLIRFVTRLLVAAYLIEAGLLLIFAPWVARVWQDNLFLDRVPWLESFLMSLFVRGAVTGLGLLT